jgi:serine/threonine protein kinase
MKLCELDLKTLKDFVTLKKEKKGNVNFSRMPATGLISLSALLYGTIDDSIRKRSAIIKSDSVYSKQNVIKKSLGMADFKIIKVLGKSRSSKIFMVELRESGEIFALKAIRKDAILYLDSVENVMIEKKILLTLEFPFLNTLINSFQNETHLFMVTPVYRGGDLFELITRNERLDEETYVDLI